MFINIVLVFNILFTAVVLWFLKMQNSINELHIKALEDHNVAIRAVHDRVAKLEERK